MIEFGADHEIAARLAILQAHRGVRRGAKNIRVPPEVILNLARAAAGCCKPE
jgi:hypothetical protein